MKKGVFLILLFLLFETSYSQAFQDTIPFRNDLGLIIIPLKFNGAVKQFAFDTGAEYSVAYGWAKKNLRKTNKSVTVRSSSNLRSKMSFYKSGKVQIGSRKITGHRVLGASENSIFSCHKVDGILGVDIIKNFNWTIDYKNKILIMYPSNYFPKKIENMEALEFSFNGRRPYVFLNLKKSRLQFLLDTGAGGYSNISKRNYNLTDLDKYPKVSFYSGSFGVNGILTKSNPVVFKIPKLTSKAVVFSPIINYNNQKSTKIGNKLWSEEELFLSLRKSKLYVSSTNINQSYKTYTGTVIFKNDKMQVLRIEVGSDLWKMGVRQGDEILQINGKKFTDFCSLDQYQRMLSKSGKSFDLQLANGKKITIAKKSYF